MSSMHVNKKFINDTIIGDIVETAEKIAYGLILIRIHDSDIVQMEVTEKFRFQNIGAVEEGGGI
ncbi:MAG: DUF2292 domain-containing protein [Pseudomonadota bacterium]